MIKISFTRLKAVVMSFVLITSLGKRVNSHGTENPATWETTKWIFQL